MFGNLFVDCDWQCYLDRHRDLQKAFGPQNLKAAKEHWKDYGRKEGRDCTCGKFFLLESS